MKYYRDKVVFVTGGASGIGKELGKQLCQLGARVHISDINEEKVHQVCAEIRKIYPNTTGSVLDVRDPEQFESSIARIVAQEGRIDILFNNAGISLFGEAYKMSLEQWNQIVDVNIKGVVHGTHCCYPRMAKQGFGQIVNISSLAGLIAFPGSTAYSMTKHAVVGLSVSLRAEAQSKGVRVNAVCPGFIDTDILKTMTTIETDTEELQKGLKPSLMPVQTCVQKILRGVYKNKGIVTISGYTRSIWLLYRFSTEFFVSKIGPRLMRNNRKRYLKEQ